MKFRLTLPNQSAIAYKKVDNHWIQSPPGIIINVYLKAAIKVAALLLILLPFNASSQSTYKKSSAELLDCYSRVNRHISEKQELRILIISKDSVINEDRIQINQLASDNRDLQITLNSTEDKLLHTENKLKEEIELTAQLEKGLADRDLKIKGQNERIIALKNQLFYARDSLIKYQDTLVIYDEIIDTLSEVISSSSSGLYGVYKPGLFSSRKRESLLRVDLNGKNQRIRAGKVKELEFEIFLVRPVSSNDLDKNVHFQFGPLHREGELEDIIKPRSLSDFRQEEQNGWKVIEVSPRNIELKNRRRNGLSSKLSTTKLKRKTFYEYKIILGDGDDKQTLSSGIFQTR